MFEIEIAAGMPSTRQGFVYVLRLQDNCWYVGWTEDVETRIASHFLGRGAQWTRLHKPEAVESVQPGNTMLENAMTIALMAKYGWKLVRGGQYLAIDLPSAPPALHKAYALKPPPPLPEQCVQNEHGVVLQKVKDSGPTSWRARVAGEKAAKTCPARGYKTIYAASEEELRAEVDKWLKDDGEGMELKDDGEGMEL